MIFRTYWRFCALLSYIKRIQAALKTRLKLSLCRRARLKKRICFQLDHIGADFKKAKEILLADISAELYEVLSPLIRGYEAVFDRKGEGRLFNRDSAQGQVGYGNYAAVLGYFWARLREAECIRLIMTLKRNDVPANEILERLSEVYG